MIALFTKTDDRTHSFMAVAMAKDAPNIRAESADNLVEVKHTNTRRAMLPESKFTHKD